MKMEKNYLSRRNEKYKANVWFTLIEVIITLTILALVFTSVMSVFLYYSTLWAKVEANRVLQSNIKVVVEHITQDIKDNGINFTSWNYSINWWKMYAIEDDILHVGDNKYYLATKTSWGWIKVDSSDFADTCWDISGNPVLDVKDKNCSLVKNTPTDIVPLSNSWVSFKNVYFHVSQDYIPKVTMNFDMHIAYGKGIKTALVESSSINIQSTISEKLLDKNLQ